MSAAANNQQLRSYEEFAASLQNFEWVKDALPGASDLDFISNASTREKESFLVLEFKRKGTPVPLGQRILLDGLASDKPKEFTVVTVHGPDEAGEYFLSGDWQGTVDKVCLSKMCKSWWNKSKGRAA